MIHLIYHIDLNNFLLMRNNDVVTITLYGSGAMEKTATLNLILEYADGGDLQSKIKERKNMKNYFKENTIWTFFIF